MPVTNIYLKLFTKVLNPYAIPEIGKNLQHLE